MVKLAFAKHLEWVARKDEADDGFDLNVEIPYEAKRPSERFFVQVKTASIQKARRDGSWSARIKNTVAVRYSNARAPVFLFAVDLRTEEVRWLNLSEALRCSPGQRSFSLPLERKFHADSSEAFRVAAREAIQEQDDHHHPPGLALNYRAQRIMKKDPRLLAKLDHIDGKERVSLSTKDGSGFPMIAIPATEADHKAMLALYEFGVPAEVKLKSFRFKGYPILNSEKPESSLFKMVPNALKKRIEIAVGPVGGPDTVNIPLNAEVRRGVRGVELRSADSSCPFEFSLCIDPNEQSDPFTFSFNWEWWRGHSLAQLPWIHKLAEFAQRVVERSRVTFYDVVHGERLPIIEFAVQPNDNTELSRQASFLQLLNKIGRICERIGSPALYNGTDVATADQVRDLMGAWDVITQPTAKCTIGRYVVTPEPEVAAVLRNTSEVSYQVFAGFQLTFGTTVLGVLPVRINVTRATVADNGDGSFTLTPAGKGDASFDPNPPDYVIEQSASAGSSLVQPSN